jgi:S-adenosylmethionine:tRNA ribosyltransferase-isomerase
MQHINLDDFDYNLPNDKIPFYPAEERGSSKLLVADIKSNNIKDDSFNSITNYLDSDSLLFINKTKVISARVLIHKLTGGRIEFLLIEPISPSTSASIVLNSHKTVTWQAIYGGKFKVGHVFELNVAGGLNIKVLSKEDNLCNLEFSWVSDENFSEVLEQIGKIPLPPYIKREVEKEDKNRYQTVFASNPGSVAAPTAALHFTNEILDEIKSKKIDINEITLHIGLGTFSPIKNNDIQQHKMHSEKISISIHQIRKIADNLNSKKITAVGTTTMRTLETIYVLSQKVMNGIGINEKLVEQWDVYSLPKIYDTKEALLNLIDFYSNRSKDYVEGETELLIMPGYNFGIVDTLITNFHAPKSTLVLLVAAFCGHNFQKDIYNHALNNNYKFLSYGDSSILIR